MEPDYADVGNGHSFFEERNSFCLDPEPKLTRNLMRIYRPNSGIQRARNDSGDLFYLRREHVAGSDTVPLGMLFDVIEGTHVSESFCLKETATVGLFPSPDLR
jgi:hypothetical protein